MSLNQCLYYTNTQNNLLYFPRRKLIVDSFYPWNLKLTHGHDFLVFLQKKIKHVKVLFLEEEKKVQEKLAPCVIGTWNV